MALLAVLPDFGLFWPQPNHTPAHSAPASDQGRHSGPPGCVWAAGHGLHRPHCPPGLTSGLLSENGLFSGLHRPQPSTRSENVQYLRTQSSYGALVLSDITQIYIFMSMTDKTGALKVLWVPRYCHFAPNLTKSLCNHMYAQRAGPLCKTLGSVPSSLRSLGPPIGGARMLKGAC